MVPGAGLEPARVIHPRDFKSLVSTNFTTRALNLNAEYTGNWNKLVTVWASYYRGIFAKDNSYFGNN